MTTYKKWEPIKIYWSDSYRTHGWLALEDAHLEEDISLDHITIGMFAGSTPRQISVVQSIKANPELNSQPETQVDAVMNIPKSCITKVERLKP